MIIEAGIEAFFTFHAVFFLKIFRMIHLSFACSSDIYTNLQTIFVERKYFLDLKKKIPAKESHMRKIRMKKQSAPVSSTRDHFNCRYFCLDKITSTQTGSSRYRFHLGSTMFIEHVCEKYYFQ